MFQTLTGKEIEIDIEPTDKVKYNRSCKIERQHANLCTVGSQATIISKCGVFGSMKVERIKERVEEKEGIPPQQQRLIYSGKQM